MTNEDKVKITTLKIAFLMKHQNIVPDLREIASELNSDSSEYLQGAADALLNLITALEQKGI